MRRLALVLAAGLLLLSAVPTFAATGNSVWRAKVTNGTVHGGATLTELANGKEATLAVKVFDVKVGTKVTVTVFDQTTGGTAIVSRDTFKAMTAAGARHWDRLTATELTALKADIKAKDTLWVSITLTPSGSTATVTLTGKFALAK
jgi:hypothetical protein